MDETTKNKGAIVNKVLEEVTRDRAAYRAELAEIEANKLITKHNRFVRMFTYSVTNGMPLAEVPSEYFPDVARKIKEYLLLDDAVDNGYTVNEVH